MTRRACRSLVAATAGVLVVAACGSVDAPGTTPEPLPPVRPSLAAPAPPALLVGLGDSIPAASNCDECASFVDLFGEHLSTGGDGTAVEVTNLGVGGWASTDLLDALTDGRPEAALTSAADVVTVTIGANDFYAVLDTYLDGECGGDDGLGCFADSLPALEDTLTAVLDRISELTEGRSTVLVTGYWNVFPDGDVARQLYGPQFVGDSAVLTGRADDVIAAVARDRGAIYVDLLTAFKGPAGDVDPTALLTDDGDHPNQIGHRRIADALESALTPSDPARAH